MQLQFFWDEATSEHETALDQIAELLSRYGIFEKTTGRIQIIVTTNERVRELNKLYRGLDRTTDVLSFQYDENVAGGDPLIGEIYIAGRQTRDQAKRYGTSELEEFSRLLIHGIYHLLGYDHHETKARSEMRALEKETLAFLKSAYPLP